MNEPKKSMYVLVWTYHSINEAYSEVIAVSDSIQRLEDEMTKNMEKHTVKKHKDDWNDELNYIVCYRRERTAKLQHRWKKNQVIEYHIQTASII